MSVFSPTPPVMQTPMIATPAVLQGEPPEWAHPTPSPSIFSICPQGSTEPNAKYAFGGQRPSAKQAPQEPNLPKVDIPMEFLFEVIRPFITEMCQALQQELQVKMDQAMREALSPKQDTQEQEGGRGSSSPPPAMSYPFHSLLNQTPTMPNKHLSMSAPMRTTAPISEGCTASDSESEQASPAQSGVSGLNFNGGKNPQKVYSGHTSPILPDMGPSPQGGSAATGPLYLSWSEQQPPDGWAGGRRTPTVSPVVPTMEPQGQGVFQSLMHPIDENKNLGIKQEGGDDDGDEGGEKSVMVCRHWKSKGFCRLEDKCKFLHLEHKRGTGVPPTKPKKTDKPGGSADENRDAAAGSGKTSRSSRRAGRNRRSGGDGGDDNGGPAAPAAPGLVTGGSGGAGAGASG